MRRSAAAIIFLILVIAFIALLMPKIMHVRQLEERSQELEQELKKIQYQNRRMETELRLLKDDPVYIEKVARKKLSKAKEGEIVYKVVREGTNNSDKVR